MITNRGHGLAPILLFTTKTVDVFRVRSHGPRRGGTGNTCFTAIQAGDITQIY